MGTALRPLILRVHPGAAFGKGVPDVEIQVIRAGFAKQFLPQGWPRPAPGAHPWMQITAGHFLPSF